MPCRAWSARAEGREAREGEGNIVQHKFEKFTAMKPNKYSKSEQIKTGGDIVLANLHCYMNILIQKNSPQIFLKTPNVFRK